MAMTGAGVFAAFFAVLFLGWQAVDLFRLAGMG